jgi:probable F420-dependent oxidoreductase
MMSLLRFGFVLPNLISPVANATALVTSAQRAEAAGFDSIWATDHILTPVEDTRYGEGTEAITTLAYLAGKTQRIGLGLSVLVLPMRNPVIVAKELASLAHLSRRELIVGVGVGWNEQEYGYLSADFSKRGKLLDEHITILRKLWTEDNPEHAGTFKFSGAKFSPRPVPTPPIWIGGESPSAISRAVRLGDGYHPNLRAIPDYGAVVREIRERSGDRHVTMSLRTTFDLRAGAEPALDTLRRLREIGLDYPVVGFKHETLAELVDAIEMFGRDVIPALRETSDD